MKCKHCGQSTKISVGDIIDVLYQNLNKAFRCAIVQTKGSYCQLINIDGEKLNRMHDDPIPVANIMNISFDELTKLTEGHEFKIVGPFTKVYQEIK